ncbi:MAG TPA: RhuM family protein [Planctomycetaceae bacterium]|nr:RhuM family protein [Planctomycetaceae bacterium]
MDNEGPKSEVVLYQTEDGRTRLQCRFENETIWLTQIQIAELFQTSVPNVNQHLKTIYDEGELTEAATIKNYLIVPTEGNREVSRDVPHYNLSLILAIGYRVRSARGTQFRHWATARLSEYLVKGFTMDDERLKNPPGPGVPDHFDELLERIRKHKMCQRTVCAKRAVSVRDTVLHFVRYSVHRTGWAMGGSYRLVDDGVAPAVTSLA